MKYVVLILCLVSANVACKKAPEVSAPPSQGMIQLSAQAPSNTYLKLFNEAAGAMYGFQAEIKDQTLKDVPEAIREKLGEGGLNAAVKNVGAAVEAARKEAVKKTLAQQKEVHFWFDLSKLSEPYQKVARFLVEASYWLHELYKLQVHPDAAALEAQVYKEGDPDSIRLFARNAGPICGRYGDPERCSVLSTYPESRDGAIMWPDGMDEKMFDEIKAKVTDPKTDPFLSPFTVVKRKSDGELEAVPYAKFPPFQRYMEKIAALLEQAAAVEGIEPSFSEQLKTQAAAFRSDDPRPYFASDEAWGKAAGELELTIGPYETYEDPFSSKAFFEFALGVEDKEATALVTKFLPLLSHIEQMFTLAVGPEVYKARMLTTKPPLRVVEVIAASGEMQKAGGPSIAFILPNIGPMADEGRQKRVIFTNHHEAKFNNILKVLAETAIVPNQLGDVDARAFALDSTFHEIMHGVGPQREAITPDGQTIALALGEYYDGLEEAKAEVGGAWASKILADNGIITQEELKKHYTTHVASLLRVMRFGAKEAHARGAALEFAYLFSHGAINIVGEQIAVNYDMMYQALTSLVGEIGRALAKGDKELAKSLLEDYPKQLPPLVDVLVKKFAAAGIPRDVALVYHVSH